jgi:hypothetical protein
MEQSGCTKVCSRSVGIVNTSRLFPQVLYMTFIQKVRASKLAILFSVSWLFPVIDTYMFIRNLKICIKGLKKRNRQTKKKSPGSFIYILYKLKIPLKFSGGGGGHFLLTVILHLLSFFLYSFRTFISFPPFSVKQGRKHANCLTC